MKYKIARVLLGLMIISVLMFISYGLWVNFEKALTIYSNQGLNVLFEIILKRLVIPFSLMLIMIYGMMWTFKTIEEERLNNFKNNKN